MMSKFRKKPVVIEAVAFGGEWTPELSEFLSDVQTRMEGGFLIIKTLEGDHRANPGDWIIKGVKGECYPCKPDIFEATYDTAE